MSKKSTDQKTEKQAEAEKLVELKDDELVKVQGGMAQTTPTASLNCGADGRTTKH